MDFKALGLVPKTAMRRLIQQLDDQGIHVDRAKIFAPRNARGVPLTPEHFERLLVQIEKNGYRVDRKALYAD
jgi:hypothetical protein